VTVIYNEKKEVFEVWDAEGDELIVLFASFPTKEEAWDYEQAIRESFQARRLFGGPGLN
jgi:hypothetical protein